ncbi:MAG: hypothetical protein HYZ59_00975 [Actinobacteria bacterium]|nr:hypothetical protein [Actinomycetota bacterium]
MRGFDEVEDALAAVLRDIRKSTVIDVSGWVTPTHGWTISLHYDDSASSMDFVEDLGWSYDQLLSMIADWVQTKLEYHLQSPWPGCPEHPNHQLNALIVDGYWVCPENKQLRFLIGELDFPKRNVRHGRKSNEPHLP